MMSSGQSFRIEYIQPDIEKDLQDMPANIKTRIREAIETRLSADPLSFGKVLRYSLRGSYRLRVGDFRVIYTVQSELHLVTVIAIKHRRIVYN